MANQQSNGVDKRPQLKVQDLETKKNPQGGVTPKAGKDQHTNILKTGGPGYK
jgi:hypothetical protein